MGEIHLLWLSWLFHMLGIGVKGNEFKNWEKLAFSVYLALGKTIGSLFNKWKK